MVSKAAHSKGAQFAAVSPPQLLPVNSHRPLPQAWVTESLIAQSRKKHNGGRLHRIVFKTWEDTKARATSKIQLIPKGEVREWTVRE